MSTILRISNGLGLRRALELRSFGEIWRAVRSWHERSRQRASLRELDAYLLRDVGLSASDMRREAEKPFWRS